MPDTIYGALSGAPNIGAAAGTLPSGPLLEAMARIAAMRRAQMGVAPTAPPPAVAPTIDPRLLALIQAQAR